MKKILLPAILVLGFGAAQALELHSVYYRVDPPVLPASTQPDSAGHSLDLAGQVGKNDISIDLQAEFETTRPESLWSDTFLLTINAWAKDSAEADSLRIDTARIYLGSRDSVVLPLSSGPGIVFTRGRLSLRSWQCGKIHIPAPLDTIRVVFAATAENKGVREAKRFNVRMVRTVEAHQAPAGYHPPDS